jgi:hypothetical protein
MRHYLKPLFFRHCVKWFTVPRIPNCYDAHCPTATQIPAEIITMIRMFYEEGYSSLARMSAVWLQSAIVTASISISDRK